MKTNPKSNIPETAQESLFEIFKQIEKEDQYIRERMLRECKQNELYWHGFQYIFWDERVQDFRIPTHDVMEQVSSREETKFIYDYVVNIFKAHGLSIIAALSSDIPAVPFSPADADDPSDINAAKKATELGKIIQKYNKSKLLFYHALFTLYTNYFVASYNYYERDPKHGTTQLPQYENKKVKTPDSYNCPDGNCGFTSPTELTNCPNCAAEMTYQQGQESTQKVNVGYEEVDLGMECIDVLGTLNVKIPMYAPNQAAIGYLIRYSDKHFAWLRDQYKDIPREKLSLTGSDNFERIARMPSIGRVYSDTYLQSLLTLKEVWIRPWMYEVLENEEDVAELKDLFPDGCKFCLVGDGEGIFADAKNECLDEHWTIGKGDLSRAVHGDPLGKPLLPLQDLKNMVANLLVESLEHSVPSTFADPEMFDFELYSKQEVSPGAVYPTKTSIQPQKRLDDYFTTLKTSTLPKEGVDYDKIVDNQGQFVVGAFPSIFGGPQTEGSKTLGEYQESRSYALQRLSIPYQLLMFWWADTIHKCVKDYISEMVDDEKHTVKAQNKFSSVSLLLADFNDGDFGLLLPDEAVDLPVSFSQKRATVQQALQLNSDTLNQYFFSPENRSVTLHFLGIDEYHDLDSNQADKQLMELEDLINSAPIEGEDGSVVSSVAIEPELDDDEIHLRVLRVYLSSMHGQELKKLNPEGYQNALLHAAEHKNNLQMQMQQQLMAQNPPAPGPPAPGNQPQLPAPKVQAPLQQGPTSIQ